LIVVLDLGLLIFFMDADLVLIADRRSASGI